MTRSRSPPAARRRFFVAETLGAATPPDLPRLRPLLRLLQSAVPVPLSVSEQPVRVTSIRRPRHGPQGTGGAAGARRPGTPAGRCTCLRSEAYCCSQQRRRPGHHHEARDASHMDDELRRHFSACCHDTQTSLLRRADMVAMKTRSALARHGAVGVARHSEGAATMST